MEEITKAEILILSILMAQPELIGKNQDSLSQELFTIEANRIIFSTLLRLATDSFYPNKQLVVNYLSSAGLLDSAGGEEYISSVAGFADESDIRNIDKYISIINNAFKSREVIKLKQIVEVAERNFEVVDIVIEDIQDKLNYISRKGRKSNTQRIGLALSTAWDTLVKKVRHKGTIGTSTGFQSLDAITGGYSGGEYWVIGGRPSHGKSSFILNTSLRSAQQGNAVLLFSLEMNYQSVVERLASLISGVEAIKIRLGTLSQSEVDAVKEAFTQIEQLPIYLSTSYEITSHGIAETIRKYKDMKDIKIVWIDYIQLATERESQAVHTIGAISRMCKLLANELDIFVGVVSQLSRSVEQRDDKRPMKADLRQSGNLEEDADLIAFTYRDELYKPDADNDGGLELIIRKHRNGPIGTLPMRFNKVTMLIEDEYNGK